MVAVSFSGTDSELFDDPGRLLPVFFAVLFDLVLTMLVIANEPGRRRYIIYLQILRRGT